MRTDLWFVEYSANQGVFHVIEANKSLDSNLAMLREPRGVSDFVPVRMAYSRKEALEIAQALEDSILELPEQVTEGQGVA